MNMTAAVTLTTLAVAAVLAAAWWLRVRSGRRRRAAARASDAGDASLRTRGGGPVSGALRRSPRGPDGNAAATATTFDPDGVPLSRDFLPEKGEPPPVERDVFAELARRRMRDDDG